MPYRVHLGKAQITCKQCYREREKDFDSELAQRFYQDAINLLQKSEKIIRKKYSTHPELDAIIFDIDLSGDMCEKCIRAPNGNDIAFSDYMNVYISDLISKLNKIEEA